VHESTFLIFDESFGSQDEERRNNTIAAPRTRGATLPLDPLSLISHNTPKYNSTEMKVDTYNGTTMGIADGSIPGQ